MPKNDLIIACVEWRNYCDCGMDYVRRLQMAVDRHLHQRHRFVCLTDRPTMHATMSIETIELPAGLQGWWNKLALFIPSMFPPSSRILYLDLDTVIVRQIDELVERKGIIHLRDWGWERDVYGSGVMVWDSGEHQEAWTRYGQEKDKTVSLHGDQDWMTMCGGWDALPFPMVCSAKYHCTVIGPPKEASVVCFHGPKKPHNSTALWVHDAWRNL